MTSLVARMSPSMYRGFRWGLGFVTLVGAAVAGSGVALLFTQEPDDNWTRLAQRGSSARPSPGLPEPLQDVHSSLTILFILVSFCFITWVVGVAIGAWSWPFVLAFVAVVVAVLTGNETGYLAVSIDGTYQSDLQGYGFLVDPGFDNTLNTGGLKSANTFRVWVAMHLLSVPAMVMLVAHGIRRWRQS